MIPAAAFFFVSYERLHGDGFSALRDVCRFLGIHAERRLIRSALATHTVEAHQRSARERHLPSAAYNVGDGRIGLGARDLPEPIAKRLLAATAETWAKATVAVDDDAGG